MSGAPARDRRPVPEAAVAARVGALFERHGRMVYGVCRAMLRDVPEAEDAAQQVFLSAHRALLAGAQVRDPGSWLATIARNECRHRIGARMQRPLAVGDEDLETLPAIVDDGARRAQLAELRAAIAALPERQRQAVVLRYVYGLRYGEVATALGISRTATEALLFRARRALHGRLRPVAGAALAVPVALRDELAQAIPGFAAGGTSGAAAVAGGVLAKLAGSSAGMKVATAAVAASTVGTVGAVETQRPDAFDSVREQAVAVAPADPAGAERDRSGHGSGGADARGKGRDRSGPSRGGDDREHEERRDGSGPGDGRRSAEAPEAEADSSGPGPAEAESENGPEMNGGPGSSGGSEPSEPEESSSGSGSGESSGSGSGESSGSGSGGSDRGSGSSGSGSGDGSDDHGSDGSDD